MVFRAGKGSRVGPRFGKSPNGRRAGSAKISAARVSLGQRGAVYYSGRSSETSPAASHRRPPASRHALAGAHAPRPQASSSAAEVLDGLNRAYGRSPVLTGFLGLTLVAALCAGVSFGSSAGATALFSATGALVMWYAYREERSGHSVAVHYELEAEAARAYRRLTHAFERLAREAVWHVQAKRTDRDRAGAVGTPRVVRRRIRPRLGLPPRVKSNLRVPALPAGRQTLYFFPDRILVYEAQLVWAVPYQDLQVETTQIRVRETERDARHAGPRSPASRGRDAWPGAHPPAGVVVNGVLRFRSRTGLSEVFRCSSPTVTAEVAAALQSLHPSPRAADRGTAAVNAPA